MKPLIISFYILFFTFLGFNSAVASQFSAGKIHLCKAVIDKSHAKVHNNISNATAEDEIVFERRAVALINCFHSYVQPNSKQYNTLAIKQAIHLFTPINAVPRYLALRCIKI